MIDFSNVENGSQFVRADLHIHSFSFDNGSFDVSDVTMTPQNIVDTALEKGLKVISITDHNEIGNSKIAIDYAKDKNILVIPGIEISTTQGHLLVYFDTHDNLSSFKGKLHIASNKETCNEGIINCLDLAREHNGIGVLAHIELSSGFERTIGRFGPQMENIFKHPNLLGLEITSKDSVDFYTDNDTESNRKNLINIRRKELDLQGDYDLAKLMSSDSHKLDKLGVNACGDGRLTRIKMDDLSFHAFKVALMTPIARIRLEDFIPEKTPHFVGIQFDGGLLKEQIVHFSNNLTCIIGGRGTGKSTMLESICETSGNSRNARVVDSDVWSDKISLVFEDETGKKTLLTREKNGEVINMTDGNEDAMTKVPIEIYGQGETAETLQHSDNNPNVLLEFLDSFIDIESLRTEDEDLRNKLIENKSDIDKLRLEVKNIPETLKLKKDREGKIKRLEKEKVGDLVRHHSALLQERALRSDLIEELKDLIEKYKNIFSDKSVFEMVNDLDGKNIIIGKDNFEEVKKIVAEFSEVVNKTSDKLDTELTSKISRLRSQLTSWKSKEADIQKEMDKKKQDLKKQGIPFDIGQINQISKDLVFYQKRLKKLLNDKKILDEKLKERKELLKHRKGTKDRIFYLRSALAKELNKNLKNTIEGFYITIKYSQGTYSQQFENHLKGVLDYRTSGVKKAHHISRNTNPIDFSKNLFRKDLDYLKLIIDEGVQVFSDSEINRIISKYDDVDQREDLESLEFEDLPSILVTKNYKDEVTGKIKHITKPLANLSLGQQQSILLAILLHSRSKNPLLIDQPEDNLDSEFVYKTIVSNLRKIKEQRQVIIVTHNPNIAVLGDAELIIPLKSTSTRSVVFDRGSVDNQKSRKISCAILEGGERAFRRRKEIYGIN
jgi:ABC-type lipoprotein export system ATPase subunit/histidinol phosphatase-like PHP family hydrolase